MSKKFLTLSSFGLITVVSVMTFLLANYNSSNKKTVLIDSLEMKLNKHQLVGLSDVAVIGTVKSVQYFSASSTDSSANQVVYENIVFDVDEYLYKSKLASTSAKEITIQTPGGELGGVKVVVGDRTPIEQGHEYVVFLKQKDIKQIFEPVSSVQGVFEIKNGSVLIANEKQKSALINLFGRIPTLDQFKNELKTAKPVVAPGQKQ